jgi:hypothetical protein
MIRHVLGERGRSPLKLQNGINFNRITLAQQPLLRLNAGWLDVKNAT